MFAQTLSRPDYYTPRGDSGISGGSLILGLVVGALVGWWVRKQWTQTESPAFGPGGPGDSSESWKPKGWAPDYGADEQEEGV